MTGRVLVVGDIMTDVIVRPEGPLVRGSDRRAAIHTRPGGSAANQACWLAHYGVDVALAGKVGAADLGRIEAELRRVGVEPRLGGDATASTGTLVTLLDPDGERSFLTDRGANDTLASSDLPSTLLDGVALLHVSGYALVTPGPRDAVRALMHAAGVRGLTITVDPASAAFLEEVGPAAFLEWTGGAAICFPNDDEAAVLAGTRDGAQQRARLGHHYAITVIKHGAGGAEVVGPAGAPLLCRPALAVDVRDTTGAGDAFLAAYLAAHLAGRPRDACLARAVAAGSAATTTLGGRPSGERVGASA